MKDRQSKTTRRKISPRKYTKKNQHVLRIEGSKKEKTSFWKSLKDKVLAYFGTLFGTRAAKDLSFTKRVDKKAESKGEEKKSPVKYDLEQQRPADRVYTTKPKEQNNTYQEWSPKGNSLIAEPSPSLGVPSEAQEEQLKAGEQKEPTEQKELQSQPSSLSIEQAVTSNKLYVGNLPYNLTDSDLFEIFAKIGPIKNVEIVRDRKSNRTKGFGFVEMADLDSARKAATVLNGIEIMGRRIIVTGAKSDRKDSSQF